MSQTPAEPNPPVEAADEAAPGGGFRPLVEALVCLALAVILFRTFQVEGYMISTGSMAPALLGFHKRVVCPSCRYDFAFGVAYDADFDFSDEPEDAHPEPFPDDTEPEADGQAHGSDESESAGPPSLPALCPNCGQSIDVSRVPRNQGDQLLVRKNAYLFHPPRRWEVIVFRNPNRPTQPYVKRIAGLPGEAVQIVDGDIYVDGMIQRKDFAQQRALRILVYDHDLEPTDAGWQPRWVPESGPAAWTRSGSGFVFDDLAAFPNQTDSSPAWVTYRHWVRSGGSHQTSVAVPEGLKDLDLTTPSLYPLQHDPEAGRLWCAGALSKDSRDRIAATFDRPEFRELIDRLYEASHVAPVTDVYGYNRVYGGGTPIPVPDLMLSLNVRIRHGLGRFVIEMTDGAQTFDFTIDAGTGEINLAEHGRPEPLRLARLKSGVTRETMQIEMSLFDRQVAVAVNGQQVFAPWPLNRLPKDSEAPRHPVRFGARGLRVEVGSLKLYRDVYYTRKGNAGEPYELGEDEFYVLGDNSPVSADSRVWPDGAVHRRLFLGRPFVVHLPSRPGRIRIGGTNVHIRIPDFSRIRYIR